MKLDACFAVITGASAGIGREFARQLASRARALMLAARRRDRLEELKTELLATNSSLRVEIRETDLSDLEQTMALAKSLAAEPVDFLINNAGLGDLGPLVSADSLRVNEQIQVNALALTILTRAVLPGMIAQKRGAILNVSSSAGFLPLPGFAVYAATKAYVTSFSEAIRAETRGLNISVTTLCPGPVKTEFTQVADRQHRPRSYGFSIVQVPAAKVARIGLCAIEQDKPMVIPGRVMKLAMAFTRLAPSVLLRLLARFTAHSE